MATSQVSPGREALCCRWSRLRPTHEVARSVIESQVAVGAAVGSWARAAAQQQQGGVRLLQRVGETAQAAGQLLARTAHRTARRVSFAHCGIQPHLVRRPEGRVLPAELHTACWQCVLSIWTEFSVSLL
jgi:hypothetical protein